MTLSLWLDAPARAWPALTADIDADVLVIGAGMTGASAALAAAQAGARVVLLEATRVAAGASGRNAGFLLAAPQAYYAEAVALHGRALARDVWRLNRDNIGDVKRLAERLGLDCGLQRTGSLVAAVSPEERDTLLASAKLQREDGFPGELLDAHTANERAGAHGLLAGIHTPDDAQVDPARFVRGLVSAAAERGARVHEGARVAALDPAPGGWVARLEGGRSVRAARVVCGLNAYAPALLAFARARVRPVRGQVLAARAPPGAGPRLPVYARHGYLYVRSAGEHVVAGGMRHVARAEEVGLEDATSETVQDAILREVGAHWPLAGRAAVTHRWSGVMGFSHDGLPWVGEIPGAPGLHSFFGCTGHGWGYGVWAGGLLARAALGEKVEIPRWCAMDRPLAGAPRVD